MHHVNIHEAKTRLSSLLREVEQGQEVVISNAGRPVARLVAYRPVRRRIRPPGGMADSGAWIAADFDEAVDALFDSPDQEPS